MNNTSNSLPVRINIATALNSKYMRYAYVMLTSLFTNQPDADIHVYLLHSDLSPQDIAYLQELADEYHHINFLSVKRETTIVHFAGMKPWEGQYVHYDIEQLWWDYAKLTPFYTELMEEFMHACINNPTVPDTMLQLSEEKRTLRDELSKTSAMCQKLLQLLQK